ncbi:MAG: hypothetical protein AAB225_30510 [Acidobacteriota bacterium]
MKTPTPKPAGRLGPKIVPHPRRKLVALTEDEADLIICLRRMREKTVSLDEAIQLTRHGLDR